MSFQALIITILIAFCLLLLIAVAFFYGQASYFKKESTRLYLQYLSTKKP